MAEPSYPATIFRPDTDVCPMATDALANNAISSSAPKVTRLSFCLAIANGADWFGATYAR